jgi:hypothetical protein
MAISGTVGHLEDVARRLLDADDLRQLRQPLGGRRLDVAAGAARHVVEHDRQVRVGSNRRVVLVDAFLRRLVVVRRHRQDAVGARIGGRMGGLDDLCRVVATGAREHRHHALHLVHDGLDDGPLLGCRERRRLARRADRHQEMNPGLDLPPREAAHASLIDSAVGGERRDQGGATASEGTSWGHGGTG